MVAARAAFLAAGWFDPLTAALSAAAAEQPVPPGAVADLGAGTGHHLAAVLDTLDDRAGVALDASVYAARRAARAHPRTTSVVADIWGRLPLLDESIAVALVVFAPRGGAEIARVLAPGGRLLVAAPTEDHLGELVQPLGLLSVDAHKDGRLKAALSPHLVRVDEHELRWPMALDRDAAAALAEMGPSARHADAAELRARAAALPARLQVTAAVRLSRWRAA